jgi:hypothetical protein
VEVIFLRKEVFRDGLSVKDVISECGGEMVGGEKKMANLI